MRGCIVGRSVRRQRDEKRRLIRVMANYVVVHLDQNSGNKSDHFCRRINVIQRNNCDRVIGEIIVCHGVAWAGIAFE